MFHVPWTPPHFLCEHYLTMCGENVKSKPSEQGKGKTHSATCCTRTSSNEVLDLRRFSGRSSCSCSALAGNAYLPTSGSSLYNLCCSARVVPTRGLFACTLASGVVRRRLRVSARSCLSFSWATFSSALLTGVTTLARRTSWHVRARDPRFLESLTCAMSRVRLLNFTKHTGQTDGVPM